MISGREIIKYLAIYNAPSHTQYTTNNNHYYSRFSVRCIQLCALDRSNYVVIKLCFYETAAVGESRCGVIRSLPLTKHEGQTARFFIT